MKSKTLSCILKYCSMSLEMFGATAVMFKTAKETKPKDFVIIFSTTSFADRIREDGTVKYGQQMH